MPKATIKEAGGTASLMIRGFRPRAGTAGDKSAVSIMRGKDSDLSSHKTIHSELRTTTQVLDDESLSANKYSSTILPHSEAVGDRSREHLSYATS
jgi:hypothetical protein